MALYGGHVGDCFIFVRESYCSQWRMYPPVHQFHVLYAFVYISEVCKTKKNQAMNQSVQYV